MERENCDYCGHELGIDETRCPHCARPGRFPNVRMAKLEAEREALSQRYRQAIERAEARGAGAQVRKLEELASRSKAVIARSLAETERLAASDQQLYTSFYRLLEAEFRIPEGRKWDRWRMATDDALFGSYRPEIRFANLTLGARGISRYGQCFWILREGMIDYRASVFEENSVMFMVNRKISVDQLDNLPRGFRAPWSDRGRLCVAKLADRVEAGTSEEDIPAILMTEGKTGEDDDFVEVHIGGPMTARSFEKVVQLRKPRQRAVARKLGRRLKEIGVELVDLPELNP